MSYKDQDGDDKNAQLEASQQDLTNNSMTKVDVAITNLVTECDSLHLALPGSNSDTLFNFKVSGNIKLQ